MARKRLKTRGKVSWFGGPNDAMNTGTALGVSDTVPGVAVRPGGHYLSGRPTLGGYWLVKIGKRRVLLRQTDIGPNQSTGRRIDVTAGALKKFGYNERNFPTDSIGSAVYLGKSKRRALAAAAEYGAGGEPAKPRRARERGSTIAQLLAQAAPAPSGGLSTALGFSAGPTQSVLASMLSNPDLVRAPRRSSLLASRRVL